MGGLAGGGFVVRGIEDDAAVETFAIAFGAEVGLVAQGEMNDATLARGHSSEVERSAGLANLFGRDSGGHAELLEVEGALIFAVEGNLLVLAGRQAQDFEGEQFQGTEKFGAAIQKQGGIGTGKIDEDLGFLPLALRGGIDDDTVFEVKPAVRDDGLQEFVDLVGGGEFIHRGSS